MKKDISQSLEYSEDQLNIIFKKNITIYIVGIIIMALLYVYINVFALTNGIIVSYLIFLQIGLFTLQAIPAFKDLFDKNKEILTFTGTAIVKKRVYFSPFIFFIVEDDNGVRFRILTYKTPLKVDNVITGSCTKHLKLLIKCNYK